MLSLKVSDKNVHTCMDQMPGGLQPMKSHAHADRKTRVQLDGDHNVLTLSRALSLPRLLNSIWKHNERMTGLTTLTSKLLHQCFHPLAFSFSTHHFSLLCSWETMTTSESWGWSYMKEAERDEATVMWLALSLHTLGSSSAKLHPSFPFLEVFHFTFFQVVHYSVFSPASLSAPFHLTLGVSLSWSKSIIISPFMSLRQLSPLSTPTSDVWTHTRTAVPSIPSWPPESRPSWRPLRPTLTKTII